MRRLLGIYHVAKVLDLNLIVDSNQNSVSRPNPRPYKIIAVVADVIEHAPLKCY